MSQPPPRQPARWLLPAILLLYLVLGTLYAVFTPAWQAPDEPAHYNYVQYLAERHRFPILKAGDYPAAYLEEIKAAHFPPEMSIAPIRYEFHQPPLYYLLAVPIYRLFGGALLPLRLLSVGLGALLLLVAYWVVLEFAPGRPYLALGSAAFVAFVPMHLAMAAAVNNDTLAELLLALLLLLAIRYLKAGIPALAGQPPDRGQDIRLLVLMGVTSGLILVTKSTIYIALPLALLAIAARHLWLDDPAPAWSRSVRALAAYGLPAVALALPWWLRNLAVYGGTDFLGLGRHDQIVVGQLRTAELVAAQGVGPVLRAFGLTSFRSFWGQFGWMGVLLDQRLYQALAILSALALAGFAFWAVRAWRRRAAFPAWQWAACGLLILLVLFTLASYIWYNTHFVQHQGRYLFRALLPLALAAALGWREALRRDQALPLAVLSLLAAAGLALSGRLDAWLLLMLAAVAGALVVRRWLPARWEVAIQACPYLFLVLLDLVSLFFFVVPQLAL